MQFCAAATDAEGEAGDRLAVGPGQARDGALADAFTERGDNLDFTDMSRTTGDKTGARSSETDSSPRPEKSCFGVQGQFEA